MNNEKGKNDKVSIAKDIREREEIINKYYSTGILDRQQAIEKIQKLRLTDEQVAAATTVRLAINSVPFDRVSDEGIISELKMQVDILTAKLTVSSSPKAAL